MDTIINLKSNKFNIDISLLHEKEQEELLLFYKYLLFKTGRLSDFKQDNVRAVSEKLPETFYMPIKVKTYQKFDRDEIYTDR